MSEEVKNRITGTVEGVVYKNDANGYTILEVFVEETKEVVTVVGTLPFVGEGETVTVGGEWVFHSEYGRQFRADSFENSLPKNASAILRYLSSGLIKGIGPKTAAKIVEKYGEDTFSVLSEHPDWIAEFRGISARRALEISEELRKQIGFYRVFDFCKDYLPTTVALRVYQAVGDEAIWQLKENPYRFCGRVDGYAFEMADKIALANGYALEGRDRIFGATVQVLKRACAVGGHACLPVKTVILEAAELIRVNPKLVAEQVKEFSLTGEIGYLHRADGSRLYLPSLLHTERSIARQLLHLDAVCVRYDFSDVETLIRRAELDGGITFAPEQRRAITEATNSGVMIITGGPGTGKTTIIKALIRIFESMDCQVALTAPTGRAAKRMSEATSHRATTVHRLLEVEYCDDETEGETTFARNERNLLEEDIIIVDEASMLDMFLTNALLSAIRPGARPVLIGDCDQLPSVGAGNVLRDLIDSERFNTVRLTEIFRQGEESLIVTNAHRINRGEAPILDRRDKDFFYMRRGRADEITNTLVDVCVHRLPKRYNVSPLDQIQVLSPTRKGGCGTEILNHLLQEKLNPAAPEKREIKRGEAVFREGDKVMQVRNNYDLTWTENGEERFGIFNGDIGVICKIFASQEYMMIDFDGREVKYAFKLLEDLEHAYAVTVHKSQGSEYPIVVLPMSDFSPMLMTRNLLYTAVTRAKEMVVLIGREDCIEKMVAEDKVAIRYTGLKFLLESANG